MSRVRASLLALVVLACSADLPEDGPTAPEARPTASDAEVRRAAVRELLTVLGFVGARDQWTEIARANVEQYGEVLDDETHMLVLQAAAESWSGDRMLDEIVSHLVDHYDGDSVGAIVGYYRSPNGMAISQAIARQSAAMSLENLQAFMEELQRSPPPETRVELVTRFAGAANSGEQATVLVVGITQRNLVALNDLLPEPLAPDVIASRAGVAAQQLRANADRQAQLAGLFSFQDLSEAELRAHVEFTESDAFRWYREQILPAIERAVAGAGRDFAAKIEALRRARS